MVFTTELETARFSRPGWIRRDFPEKIGDGAIFQIKAETALLSRQKRRQRDQETIFRYRSGCGAGLRSECRRRDFPDQDGDGATFQTEEGDGATKKQFYGPNWIRCDFSDQVGDGATFQTEAETARPRFAVYS